MCIIPSNYNPYSREAGVGCAVAPPSSWQMDNNRTELLQLLVTCCSESLYCPPQGEYPLGEGVTNVQLHYI